jgi:glycosyltransferase involved in cell wall biosynthesis
MKILTIGASPYLLVRNGKMNADIIKMLLAEGHDVSSAVWHHDESYFMPTSQGIHNYEENNQFICKLFPFTPKTDEASPIIYELMKTVQPEMIITIGDHKDTNFISAVKSMYPNLFKWIAIYTTDCRGISSINKDAFEYADASITTSIFGLQEIISFANINGFICPYGPSDDFYDMGIERSGIVCSSRNSQSSNIAAFVMGTASLDCPKYLHTNLYDPGDYNIETLVEKYRAKNFAFTTDYCSINDGIPVEKMREIYNKHAFCVDCSIKSATALSLLEAMRCGCIPIGPNYGRVGEIISQMPEGYQFFVQYNIFIGQNEEEFAIVSPEHLHNLLDDLLGNKDMLLQAQQYAKQVALKYSNKKFMSFISETIKDVKGRMHEIALDCYE